MIRAAAWILEQESKAINWIVTDDAHPADVLALKFLMAASTAPIWISVATAPYYQLSQMQVKAAWALTDIGYSEAVTARYGSTAAKYKHASYWNYFPRTRAFASRGGWRFVATRVGSKFLGPVGVALVIYDAWLTGIWIGEQLFGEMD